MLIGTERGNSVALSLLSEVPLLADEMSLMKGSGFRLFHRRKKTETTTMRLDPSSS